MRTKLLAAAAAVLIGVGLSALPALADSAGNFTADIESSACQMSVTSGALSCAGSTTAGQCIDNLTAQIDESSGSGNALLVTPSLVTGLLTDTNVSSGGKNKSSVTAAIVAHVTVTRPDGTVAAVPPDTCVQTDPSTGACVAQTSGPMYTNGVIYDQRFQQLSTNIFNSLTNCATTSGTTTACSIDLVLSTLSAHGFNFVVPPSLMEQGTNTLNVGLEMDCYSDGVAIACTNSGLGTGTVNACVGPGTLTVQQVKNFANDGSITN